MPSTRSPSARACAHFTSFSVQPSRARAGRSSSLDAANCVCFVEAHGERTSRDAMSHAPGRKERKTTQCSPYDSTTLLTLLTPAVVRLFLTVRALMRSFQALVSLLFIARWIALSRSSSPPYGSGPRGCCSSSRGVPMGEIVGEKGLCDRAPLPLPLPLLPPPTPGGDALALLRLAPPPLARLLAAAASGEAVG